MSLVSSGGVHARLALSGRSLAIAIIAALAAWTTPAEAFDFQDGRLQIHGYFEEQIRGVADNFSLSDNLDLWQWATVLSVELEYDFAPDGWGPFDVLSGFARVDVRYDCVWTRACGIFPSAERVRRSRRAPARLQDHRSPQRVLRTGVPRQPGILLVGFPMRTLHADRALHAS